MPRSTRELSDLIAAVSEAGLDPTGAPGGGSTVAALQRGRMPHLAGAVRTWLRLAEVGALERASAEALDHWRQAVFLVDGQAHVHAANRAGEALLRAADGIALEPARDDGHGRLRAATPAATIALRHLLAEASAVTGPLEGASDDGATEPRPMALRLERPSGRPALLALVAPLHREHETRVVRADASVAVFVSDPTAATDEEDCLVRDRLRAAFQLTPAEAAVAVALAGGDGLRAVAAAHGVTLATVRTQARQVFRKTGVRGQTALARLVERLAQVR
jgi:DNA-binding CsgD family transcriptional regulator